MKDWIVVAGLVIIAAIELAFGGQSLWSAVASLSWEHTTGEVIEAEVVRTSRRWTRPQITYTYAVDGHTYTSSRLDARLRGRGYRLSLRARSITDQYSVGEKVDVYYEPNAPETALLRPGFVGVSWWTLLVGLGFLGAAIAIIMIE